MDVHGERFVRDDLGDDDAVAAGREAPPQHSAAVGHELDRRFARREIYRSPVVGNFLVRTEIHEEVERRVRGIGHDEIDRISGLDGSLDDELHSLVVLPPADERADVGEELGHVQHGKPLEERQEELLVAHDQALFLRMPDDHGALDSIPDEEAVGPRMGHGAGVESLRRCEIAGTDVGQSR